MRPSGAGHVTEPALWEGPPERGTGGGTRPRHPTPAPGSGLRPSSQVLPPACLSSPCLNGGSCHLIVATGTTVCACPPGYAGRLCNIGESPSLERCGPHGHGPGSQHSRHPQCLPNAASWGPAPSTEAWPARRPQASDACPGTPTCSTRSCTWTPWVPRPSWAWAPMPTAGQHCPHGPDPSAREAAQGAEPGAGAQSRLQEQRLLVGGSGPPAQQASPSSPLASEGL